MSDEYIFTENEMAKMLDLTKEGLRSRRRKGKLEGFYTIKNNTVLYKRMRPKQRSVIQKNRTIKTKSRGAHLKGEQTRYPNYAFKQHNELKMLARLKNNIDQETQDLLPEAIEIAKKQKQTRIQTSLHVQPIKNYGGFIHQPSHKPSWSTSWKPLFAEQKDEYDRYLEEHLPVSTKKYYY